MYTISKHENSYQFDRYTSPVPPTEFEIETMLHDANNYRRSNGYWISVDDGFGIITNYTMDYRTGQLNVIHPKSF